MSVQQVLKPLAGSKEIKLVEHNGDSHTVADIEFTSKGDQVAYQIRWRDGEFDDHFLSMRPFKCLEGRCEVLVPRSLPL